MPDDLTTDDDLGALRLETGPIDALPAEAISVSGQVARGLREVLDAADASEVVRLVPPPRLADRLARNELAYMRSSGDRMAILKERESGRIAGHARIEDEGIAALDAAAEAVWQGLAIATSQHYLAEINHRLQALEHGISDLVARDQSEQMGHLRAIDKSLQRMLRRRDEGARLDRDDLERTRDWLEQVQRIGHQASENCAAFFQGWDEARTAGGELWKVRDQAAFLKRASSEALRDYSIAQFAAQLEATIHDLILEIHRGLGSGFEAGEYTSFLQETLETLDTLQGLASGFTEFHGASVALASSPYNRDLRDHAAATVAGTRFAPERVRSWARQQYEGPQLALDQLAQLQPTLDGVAGLPAPAGLDSVLIQRGPEDSVLLLGVPRRSEDRATAAAG